ncbi:MAG TPA: phosphotransferase [Steroidobacteraceae bacterium]|jgi:thiamine kinase|nr:phosphotransferase [Steroidobacteraceae bacterium]
MVQDLARARASDLIPEYVLEHVPGYASGGLTARAARLYGGTVNTSFRVDTGAGRFVVRLHDPLAHTLGANHEREAQLHAAAAAAGLAPALVHVDPDHRFMVMEFISGPVWSAQDFARPDRLTRLAAALYSLHSLAPPPVERFDIPAVLAAHYERLAAAAPDERGWLARLMRQAEIALAESGTQERAKGLVHNDLYHSNLIGAERLYLLDWEYAAVADPLFDLACILAYYPQAAVYADALLDASGLAAVATPEMLRQATWLFILLSYFWYRSRRLAGMTPTPAAALAEQELRARLG